MHVNTYKSPFKRLFKMEILIKNVIFLLVCFILRAKYVIHTIKNNPHISKNR